MTVRAHRLREWGPYKANNLLREVYYRRHRKADRLVRTYRQGDKLEDTFAAIHAAYGKHPELSLKALDYLPYVRGWRAEKQWLESHRGKPWFPSDYP